MEQKKNDTKPKVIGDELMVSGKWLKLKKVKYLDQKGSERIWETLERTTHGRAEVDAVEIVGIIKKKGQVPLLVVIKQFRPPTENYIIELPAGLVDSNENPSVAAIRELREETGYVGKVVDESMTMLFGMAISNTTCKIVTVEIDGDLPENQNPKQELEDGEYVEVMTIPMDKILERMKDFQTQGYGLDGKILMIGTAFQVWNKMMQ